MDSVILAVIAVAGTILGTVSGTVTAYFLQERSARRAEARVTRKELRAERADVYSAYLTSLAELRRGELDRYDRRLTARDSDAALSARAESSRLQSAAQAVLSKVRLVVGDNAELEAAAQDAFEETLNLRGVRDRDDLSARSERATAAAERFTALAKDQVQPGAQGTRERRPPRIRERRGT